MKQTKITRINYAIETYRKNCSSYALELSKSRLSKDANYRECLLGRDSIYIPIDKCASNSMRKVLIENGFISMEKIRDWDKALEKFKDWNHFAVVRQPVNRYNIVSIIFFLVYHPLLQMSNYLCLLHLSTSRVAAMYPL